MEPAHKLRPVYGLLCAIGRAPNVYEADRAADT